MNTSFFPVSLRCFCLCLLFSLQAAAQLPATRLFLFTMHPDSSGDYTLSHPKWLSAFNPNGYNNQPAFFDDNTLYLTVGNFRDTVQTDIYALHLASRQMEQVTATPESEYSPTLMPGRRHFSCIRSDADKAKTQRLWQYPLNRTDAGREISALTGVGYHCWLNDSLVALFIVGKPHNLVIENTRTGKTRAVTSNIGRCLRLLPDGRLAFVQKLSDNSWFVKAYDAATSLSENLVQTLPGSEDFAVLPDGSLLMGKDSKLYRYDQALGKTWREIADLSAYGILHIERLAVNSKYWLALVTR